MKLSLAWIFDHINSSWYDHDVPSLMERLHTTTAEIEHYEFYTIDFSKYTLVQLIEASQETALGYSSELNKKFSLPMRPDGIKNHYYLIKNDTGGWRWAQLQDFSASKESLLPEFSADEKEFAGGWKKNASMKITFSPLETPQLRIGLISGRIVGLHVKLPPYLGVS